MTNNTAVTEAEAKHKKVTDLLCEGNHPDGPVHAVSHFHEDGPLVCGTHYARMRQAEMKAKRGQEKAAVEAAMKEPAPTKKDDNNKTQSQATHYAIAGLEVPEMVGVWLETAAKIRKMTTEALLVEIATEYYNQTCPEYLRKDVGESETTQGKH